MKYRPRHLTVRPYKLRLYGTMRGSAANMQPPTRQPTEAERIRELKRLPSWERSKRVRMPTLKFLNPDKENTL